MARREDGRFIVSFSEVKMFSECAHKWKAYYEEGAKEDPRISQVSQHLAWGSSFHDAVENLLSAEVTNYWLKSMVGGVQQRLTESQEIKRAGNWRALWMENVAQVYADGLEVEKNFSNKVAEFTPHLIESLPQWLSDNFGDYKVLAVEPEFERALAPMLKTFGYDSKSEVFLKGFIDLIVQAEDGKIYLLDWKTSFKGWSPFKRRDKDLMRQIRLYKACLIQSIYENTLEGNPYYTEEEKQKQIQRLIRNIKTEYVIVRPRADDKAFERFAVSSGAKSILADLRWVNRCSRGMLMGMTPKDPTACRFCPLAETKYCDQPKWQG